MKLIKIALIFFMIILMLMSVSSCRFASPVSAEYDGDEQEDKQTELLVIMYHHMTQSQKYVNDYNILVSQFERDLMYLKDNGYETVTSGQLLDYAYSGKELPEKPCMITFDDGFRSVYVYAYPLLQQYGMKAVVNIVGAFADEASQSDDNNVLYAYLSWDEIRELDKSGVFEIGNHTYNMHSLNSMRTGCTIMKNEDEDDYRERFTEDIGGLQDKCFEELGHYPQIFAYPFGSKCRQAQDILKEMSFKIALTCAEKINVIDQSGEEMLSLNRFNRSGNITSEQFFGKCLK